jgi:hypothetical protein
MLTHCIPPSLMVSMVRPAGGGPGTTVLYPPIHPLWISNGEGRIQQATAAREEGIHYAAGALASVI